MTDSFETADFATTRLSRQPLWTRAMTIQALILAGVLLFHYHHAIERLVYKWGHDGNWSHGFIVPFFSLYYLYLQRHRMPLGLEQRSSFARLCGALLLTAAFLIHVKCTFARISYPTYIAIIMSVMGIVLMVCGGSWARWSWFAIAFLIFAMPVPERLYRDLTMPLRILGAQVSAGVLSLIPDMIAETRGTVVDYIYRGQSNSIDIEQACSGMRLLITMSALGVAMAFISERPLWHRLIMILTCVPIAIFCNIIRVTATGLMVVFGRDDLARGFWHTMLGLGMLMIAFSLYGSISYILNNLFVEHEPDELLTADVATGGPPQ